MLNCAASLPWFADFSHHFIAAPWSLVKPCPFSYITARLFCAYELPWSAEASVLPGCFSDWLPLARARYLRRKTSAHRACRRRTLRQPIAAASDEAYFAEKILVPALPFVGSRRGVEPELR